jgi:hypothetical protein
VTRYENTASHNRRPFSRTWSLLRVIDRRLLIEPALVDRLLAETAEGADALPLLALSLERLYRDYGDDGDLTVADTS